MLEFVLKESSIDCIFMFLLTSFLFSKSSFLIDFRKYYNILRCWIFDFHELKARIIKIKHTHTHTQKKKKHLQCFTLHVIYFEYMKVSLFEMLHKKLLFPQYFFFLDAHVQQRKTDCN